MEKVFCHQCGESVTLDKVVVIGEGCYCGHCAINQLHEGAEETASGGSKSKKNKLRGKYVLAMIWGIIPGAGHMYMGLMNRGIQLFIALLAGLFGKQIFGPLVLIVPLIFFYSLFDLLQIIRAKRQGEKVEDQPFVQRDEWPLWLKDQRKWGFGLIFLGTVGLLEMSYFWSPLIQRGFSVALLFGAGLWLLLTNKEKKQDRNPA